jgi:hypothetical protein
MKLRIGLVCASLFLLAIPLAADAADWGPVLSRIKAVGKLGEGGADAGRAWAELTRASASDLPQILASLDDANPIAANYLRAAVDAVAAREIEQGVSLPAADLEAFALDQSHAPRARRLAFEWLARVDSTAPDRLIPGMLNDPSVEFRRDAVARLVKEADLLKTDKPDEAAAIYIRALSGARDEDQIDSIASTLTALGRAPDLVNHFGMIVRWKLLGPFDNGAGKGFAVAYPPEGELDLAAEYDGKGGRVKWLEHSTSDRKGLVNLNTALGNHKGAVAYATAEFVSDEDREVEVRLGSVNATRLWVNDRLVDEHEVYHQGGTRFDQYISRVRLKKGTNRLLLKVCQNEQTEEWAQEWQFMLRVCDDAGTAIHSRHQEGSAGR